MSNTDLLTELQRHFRDVNDQFAAVLEQLVHVAPAAPLDGDDRVEKQQPGTVSQAELQAKAQELSAGVVQRFKDINAVIDKLPDLSEPIEEQDARITKLLAEHYALRKELGTVMQETERKLEEVHGCYEVLADHALSQGGKLANGGSA